MNALLEYAIRRLLAGLLVVLAATILLFLIMQMMPGDPIQLVSSPRVSDDRIAELQAQWGLDKPVIVQYFYWLGNVFRGNFGTSIITHQKVSFLISSRLPYTLLLTGLALVLQYIIAVPLGLWAAVRQDSFIDKALVSGTVALRAIPDFWLGILLIIVFSLTLRIFPVSGYSGAISLVLPVATVGLPYVAETLRLTRAEVLEVLREKYVVTAYAKGLPRRRVLVLHVLRNALIPVTVMFFLQLPWLIGGAVIVEKIFAWPGMGMLLWRSISSQDFPVVQAIIFVIAVLTVISNTIGDIITAFLDPRINSALADKAQ